MAAEIAHVLDAPLDVLVVRKISLPGHEELAMGTIASGGVRVFDPTILSFSGVDQAALAQVIAQEQAELDRRERAYRGDRPPLELEGRTVILVDDGLATGATMQAALAALRACRPAWIVAAVPVCAAVSVIGRAADDVVCPVQPEPFVAIDLWYASFPETTDEEVRALLEAAAERQSSAFAFAPTPPPV